MSEAQETNLDGQVMAPHYLRAFTEQQVKAVNKANREVMHLITTASVDRAGDVVDPKGADLSNYLKNPVVMADHDYSFEKVVGSAKSIEITEDGIMARTAFRDTPLGNDAFKLASENLGGWSIGFRPVEYDSLRDDKGRHKGFRFTRWELLEYSIVAIPMNPDIVNQAIKRGLVSQENVATFFRCSPSQDAAQGPTADTEQAPPRKVVEPHPALLRAVGRAHKRLHIYAIERAFEDALRQMEGK